MTHRPRRAVGPVALKLLRPCFRYSETRNAFVLRGFGRRGPVLVRRERERR